MNSTSSRQPHPPSRRALWWTRQGVTSTARDADFTAAGDRVRYRADVGGATGPFAIEVELRYQTIGYRWAANLEKYDAPEPKRFVGYYKATSQASSVVVTTAGASVP